MKTLKRSSILAFVLVFGSVSGVGPFYNPPPIGAVVSGATNVLTGFTREDFNGYYERVMAGDIDLKGMDRQAVVYNTLDRVRKKCCMLKEKMAKSRK